MAFKIHPAPDCCPLCGETKYTDKVWDRTPVRWFACDVYFDQKTGKLAFFHTEKTCRLEVATAHMMAFASTAGFDFSPESAAYS